MLKKMIKYTDFDGTERNEAFYFNLTKAELTKMELSEVGGYRNLIRRIIASENIPEITKQFDTIIRESYGEKSPDGRRFIKIAPDGHKLADDFMQTEAYSELFIELMSNPDSAGEFVNGIIPADIAKKASEMGDDPELKELAGQLNIVK